MDLPEIVNKDEFSSKAAVDDVDKLFLVSLDKFDEETQREPVEDLLRATTPILGTGRKASKTETGIYLSADAISTVPVYFTASTQNNRLKKNTARREKTRLKRHHRKPSPKRTTGNRSGRRKRPVLQ